MKNKKVDKYKQGLIGLIVILVCLVGAVVFLVAKNRTEEKYHDVFEYLLTVHIMKGCKELGAEIGQRIYCEVKDYGITKDGWVYAEYVEQRYDDETYEQNGETEVRRVYFWQDKSRKDELGHGFSEAYE